MPLWADNEYDLLLREYESQISEARKNDDDKKLGDMISGRMSTFYNLKMADSVTTHFEDDMAELKHIKQWNAYYDVWTCYINTLIYYSFNKNMALREVQQMFNDAMERNNSYGQGIAYYTMGSVYLNMNHLEESAAAFRKSINLLLKQEQPPVYTPEVFSYLGDVLNEQEKFDDLQKLTIEWETFNHQFLKAYPQLNQDYQSILWFYYHIACAQAAIGQNRLEDAEASVKLAEENRGDDDSYETLQWLVTKAQLRLKQGRYTEALELNTRRLNLVPQNEDKGVYLSVARQRGEILTCLHRYEESSALYHDMYQIIYASEFEADISEMTLYAKKKLPIGFVKATDVLHTGMPITVRSLEGDMDLTVEDDLIIMIGVKGEVYPNRLEKFQRSNTVLDEKYDYDKYALEKNYIPTIKNRLTGQNHLLTDFAHVCIPKGEVKIYVKELTKGVKVFTAWDKEKYMLGKPGDYLAVRCDDLHDVYIIERKIFGMTYEKVDN